MAAKKIKKEDIRAAYIDHVLMEGKEPSSVYAFAKANKMKESDFYDHFSSFEAIEKDIWSQDIESAIAKIKKQDVWADYSARERILSFFYTYFEVLKDHRSFVVYSMKPSGSMPPGKTPTILKPVRETFLAFCTGVLGEGLESGELTDRKGLNRRYKDVLWLEFLFVLDFWIKDNSKGFEKTDEAIEKGVNVIFDFIGRNPIDSLVEYGKFLFQNASR